MYFMRNCICRGSALNSPIITDGHRQTRDTGRQLLLSLRHDRVVRLPYFQLKKITISEQHQQDRQEFFSCCFVRNKSRTRYSDSI